MLFPSIKRYLQTYSFRNWMKSSWILWQYRALTFGGPLSTTSTSGMLCLIISYMNTDWATGLASSSLLLTYINSLIFIVASQSRSTVCNSTSDKKALPCILLSNTFIIHGPFERRTLPTSEPREVWSVILAASETATMFQSADFWTLFHCGYKF